jgi:fimbrial chaperone protein
MTRTTSIGRFAALALLACIGTTSFAGQFTVTPLRIFMTVRDRAVAVTIVNDGDADVVMQAELFSWAQKGGEDDLQPTDDLVMAPPIMKVPARSRQVLRLVRLVPPTGEEQTYRVLVREVPEASSQGEGVQMRMAIAFSLPIFITPPGAKRQLNCLPVRLDEKLVAQCENTGTAYAQVRSFALLDANEKRVAGEDGPTYFLSRTRRTVALKAADRVPAGHAKLVATFDDGTSQMFEANLPE